MLGVFAEFETNLHKERQLEGIAKAKAAVGPPCRPLKSNLSVAWPEICFCGVHGRPRRHHTSTIGFDLPDYSRRPRIFGFRSEEVKPDPSVLN
jgi:hypothetical protein